MSKTTTKTRNTKSTVKETILKLTKDNSSTEYSNVQKHCNKKGADYEELNNKRLLDRGLKPEKKSDATVSYTEGGQVRKKIPDHFLRTKFGNFWIESTIMLDETRADEFNDKKNKVSAAESDNKNFVIFFEQNPNQKTRNSIKRYVKILENNGWTVLVGAKQIEDWLDELAKKVNANKKLNVASVKMIPVKDLVANITNREIDFKRCEELSGDIIREGFTSQINVVPEFVRGRFTGRYVIYDGHHRYHAVTDYVIAKYGYELDELPCVIVDWITSEDKDELHALLIAHNTRTTPWGVQQYVESHLGDALNRNDKQKIISYDSLKWMYDAVKESHQDNTVNYTFSASRLFYVFGPVDFLNDSITKPVDRAITKSGKYRTTQKEIENVMKPFVMNVGMRFLHWFDMNLKDTDVARQVGDVFLKYLYHLHKDGHMTDKQVQKTIEKFKKLGDKTPINVVKTTWYKMFEDLGIDTSILLQ
jgi:hypothetical protein